MADDNDESTGAKSVTPCPLFWTDTFSINGTVHISRPAEDLLELHLEFAAYVVDLPASVGFVRGMIEADGVFHELPSRLFATRLTAVNVLQHWVSVTVSFPLRRFSLVTGFELYFYNERETLPTARLLHHFEGDGVLLTPTRDAVVHQEASHAFFSPIERGVASQQLNDQWTRTRKRAERLARPEPTIRPFGDCRLLITNVGNRAAAIDAAKDKLPAFTAGQVAGTLEAVFEAHRKKNTLTTIAVPRLLELSAREDTANWGALAELLSAGGVTLEAFEASLLRAAGRRQSGSSKPVLDAPAYAAFLYMGTALALNDGLLKPSDLTRLGAGEGLSSREDALDLHLAGAVKSFEEIAEAILKMSPDVGTATSSRS